MAPQVTFPKKHFLINKLGIKRSLEKIFLGLKTIYSKITAIRASKSIKNMDKKNLLLQAPH
jgi:hypothetical protein